MVDQKIPDKIRAIKAYLNNPDCLVNMTSEQEALLRERLMYWVIRRAEARG